MIAEARSATTTALPDRLPKEVGAVTNMTARELMTPHVLTVGEEMPVAELAAFFAENEITGAAVTNERGKLVGVVSLTDVAARGGARSHIVRSEFAPDLSLRGWEEIYNREEVAGLHVEHAELSVRDIMNPAVYTVSEDTAISEVAEKMLRGPLHRIFVARGDELAGVISTFDFLKLFADGYSTAAAGLAAESRPTRSSDADATPPA